MTENFAAKILNSLVSKDTQWDKSFNWDKEGIKWISYLVEMGFKNTCSEKQCKKIPDWCLQICQCCKLCAVSRTSAAVFLDLVNP